MRQLTMVAAVALMLAPTVLSAQPHSERGMRPGSDGALSNGGDPSARMERLIEYLDLSDAQRVQIEESMIEHRESRQALSQSMRARNESLQAMLESATPDATAIGNSVLERHELRKQMTAHQEAQISALRQMLTPEQAEKFDALMSAREFTRGEGGGRGQRKGRHSGQKPTDG
jgi:Spy/CpxP family protein refolding chaperone